ncbi:MAG: single-stranded-DNA-specific exonuclease RecJ [Planctomycetaceae bacterium]|nr:single-stranded-DNA-specific exonuclease RecJ [Planctomycetaceae bacterium]
MPRTWRISHFDEACVRSLSSRLGVSAVLAQVLSARGYASAEQAGAFLDSKLTELLDPELLPGVCAAADRIVAAVSGGRKITIYGDYDVDGVTATSLLWHCLKLVGGKVEYYVPSRLEEGYGLNCEALRRFHEDDPAQLVVTVDCGIASVREAELARELGLELIVTDHHQFGSTLPPANALVHPRLPGTAYPFGDLCGVGVAFKLAWAICTRMGDGRKASPRMREFLLAAVGLTAIGTVADVVPLLGENRVFVRFGLQSLRERASPGLQALLKVTKLHDKSVFSAEDIGFSIAPRINAAGRLGQARLAVELLTTDNLERAGMLAAYLEEQNKARQTVERRIFKQAKELLEAHPEWNDQPAIVLTATDWHAGVIGIVASRVAEHCQKPAVMIAVNLDEQLGQGSARTFGGFDLHAGLAACAEHLQTFGGHQAAAGLRIVAEKIDPFREAFCRYVGSHHIVNPIDLELKIDAEVRLADLTVRAVTELDRLGPFGRSNPRPVLASSRVELAEAPRKMGEGERHLSLKLRHYGKTMRAVAFGKAEWADQIAAVAGPISISFAPSINRFRGQENVELQLLDWQES